MLPGSRLLIPVSCRSPTFPKPLRLCWDFGARLDLSSFGPLRLFLPGPVSPDAGPGSAHPPAPCVLPGEHGERLTLGRLAQDRLRPVASRASVPTIPAASGAWTGEATMTQGALGADARRQRPSNQGRGLCRMGLAGSGPPGLSSRGGRRARSPEPRGVSPGHPQASAASSSLPCPQLPSRVLLPGLEEPQHPRHPQPGPLPRARLAAPSANSLSLKAPLGDAGGAGSVESWGRQALV